MSDCCDSSDENVFDVAVIGAGSAGFSAAITAADEGARVALIGYDTIGGTCVNVGCVPSKTLIRAAESLHNAAASKRFDGIEVTASVTDWSAVVAQKQALVDELRNAKYIDVLPSYSKIAYKEGKASFTESGDLTVDGELLELLPEAEPEISSALTEYFQAEGIRVLTCNAYREIEKTNTGLKLSVDVDGSRQVLDAEKLLVATGRSPNTKSLNLAAANIRTGGNHGIEVDSHMCTSREGVYAAGDVTGTDQFVYMAAYGAKIAARNAMNGNSLNYENAVMPAVVFTDPQVASVGLTEAAATSQGYEVKTSTLTLDNVPRALAARDTRGLIKLVADGSTDKLLGAHILAPEGADSIQAAAIAIKAGMTYRQLGEMIFPYLTTVEGLKLAAQTFDMDVKKLSCCAG